MFNVGGTFVPLYLTVKYVDVVCAGIGTCSGDIVKYFMYGSITVEFAIVNTKLILFNDGLLKIIGTLIS